MTGWFEGRVAANLPAAAGMRDIHIDVAGTPLVGSHRMPGQYVRLALGSIGEGTFAIASGPHHEADTFELLVKEGSELADALIAAPVGTAVRVSAPEGPGFPLEKGYGRRLLLFATGSGISAIRSLIQSIRRERSRFGGVTLFFGARRPDAFAYRHEFSEWEADGICIVLTVSRPDVTGWEGLTGYVQAHLPEDGLQDAVAFVCGQAEMVEGVREVLRQRGMPEHHIFQNF